MTQGMIAVPGGNVYVTLPLMTFVKNKEELAGVLCHETSHDIHHDVVHLAQKEQTTGLIATGLAILLGRNSGLGAAGNYAKGGITDSAFGGSFSSWFAGKQAGGGW